MVGRVFFVMHYKHSYKYHPDLIGFYVKYDLNRKPIRDKEGKLVPENPAVNDLSHGDTIVYCTRGDHLIRGILEVCERLEEDDKRRPKDWTRGLIQFTIRPLLTPKSDLDFRNIFRKEGLDLFDRSVDDSEERWHTLIKGKNNIVTLSLHDFHIIERALRANCKSSC